MDVLVTGGMSGIGLAAAQDLATAGAAVQVLSRKDADFSRTSAVLTLADRITQKNKTLDWIIHAAGHIDMSECDGLSADGIDTTFSVNVYAPILLTDRLQQTLTHTGGVIFIASTAGLQGNGRFPIYAASKAALIAYAKSLAFQWEHTNRKSIIIAPGPTNTPMRQRFGDAADYQSPHVISSLIMAICTNQQGRNGDLFIIRDGTVSLHEPR